MKHQTFEGHGLPIAADVAGDPEGPVVLFMHGGGQTRHSWGKAARHAASSGYRAVSLDLRGHGDSGWSDQGDYSMDAFAADARSVIRQIGRPVSIVGASLGGLTGLVVAGEREADIAVDALVLVDVTPRIEMEGAKEVGAFMYSAPDGFASLEEAADAVSAYLPHRPRPTSTAGLRKNLRLREDGRYHWHWDPSMRAGRKGPDPAVWQARLEDAARSLSMPTLLVRGGMSRIVSEQSVEEFRALVPHARYVNVAGADHMVAGDKNDAFNAAVFDFLQDGLAPAGT
jgi:pimeloyl-ACP methyl ester carboxylesterase